MTPDEIAQLMLGVGALFLVYQLFVRMMRCNYCGAINTHEPHCPYANTGMKG